MWLFRHTINSDVDRRSRQAFNTVPRLSQRLKLTGARKRKYKARNKKRSIGNNEGKKRGDRSFAWQRPKNRSLFIVGGYTPSLSDWTVESCGTELN